MRVMSLRMPVSLSVGSDHALTFLCVMILIDSFLFSILVLIIVPTKMFLFCKTSVLLKTQNESVNLIY